MESMPAVGMEPPITDPSVDMPFLSMLKPLMPPVQVNATR
jgi:hypothetical protein